MSVDQFIAAFNRTTPAAPKIALPLITFTDSVTFHLNGDDVESFHVPPAQTDGDSIIRFAKADVIHMGDCYFNGLYPFVDVDSGGSFEGMIGAADRVLKLIGPATKVIPGHGLLSDKAGLTVFRDMLAGVRDVIKPMIAAGKTKEQVVAAHPTKDFDAKWGGGFLNPDQLAAIAYSALKGK
jgi:glyoxylase-like metal-dependent hydrolase (beta-lactamase superfamily II)